MNERLIFFCDRDQRPCYLYRLGVSKDGTSYLYQIYCRSTLDEILPERPEQRIDTTRLLSQIATAGGGLVAETRQTGDLVVLNVQIAPASGYESAQNMFILAPGHEPKSMPINGCDILLSTGKLALVPATGDDEANFVDLIEHLKRLPGDYRGLVLDVLRQPGINGAIRRLIQQINALIQRLDQTPAEGSEASGHALQRNGPPAPETGNTDRAQRVTSKGGIREFWPWLLVSLMILNLTGLAFGAWLLSGRMVQKPQIASATPEPFRESPQPENKPPETTIDAGAKDTPSPSQPQLPDDGKGRIAPAPETDAVSAAENTNDPKQAINGLIETWMLQAHSWPEDDLRRIVVEGHFSSNKGPTIYGPNWLDDLAGAPKAPYFRHQERIAYALAKLVLLDDGIEIPDKERTLRDFKSRTNVKDAINLLIKKLNTAKGDERKQLEDDQHLLAWFACEVFPKKLLDGKAQFVRVTKKDDPDKTDDGEKDPDNHDVDLNLACNAVDQERVLRAIKRHQDLLQTTSQ